jgi:Flp pilus assembly protein CpaB
MNYTLRNLLVAAALMLIGILAVVSFLRAERAELSRGKQEVQVLVAAKDIPAGTTAKELEAGGYVEVTEVLREDAPASAIGKMSSLKVDGKWLTSNETVYQGEILTTRAFDDTQGLAPTHQIKGNERLFATPVQAAWDTAGLIKPGDHVDIMVASGDGFTWVVARDVEVIETPTSLRPEGSEVAEEAPDAEGDTKLYVFKATDREMADIKFALSNDNGDGLMLALRPSNGDTETNIRPILPQVKFPDAAPTGTQPGPNPATR